MERIRDLKRDIRSKVADAWLGRVDEAEARLRALQPKDDKEKAALINGDAGPLAAWIKMKELPPEKWDTEWKRQQASTRKLGEKLAEFCEKSASISWRFAANDRLLSPRVKLSAKVDLP